MQLSESKEDLDVSYRLWFRSGPPGGHDLRVTWMVIDQLDSMIIDPSALGEFGNQVRREHVHEVGILDGVLCRSLLGYQVGYLRSDVNYVGLMLRVKLCSCNFFLPTSSARLVVGRASSVV